MNNNQRIDNIIGRPRYKSNSFENTGIFKDTFELFRILYEIIKDFPAYDKEMLGKEMLKICKQMFVETTLAYKEKQDKIKHIDNFIFEFESLKLYTRIAEELKRIGINQKFKLYSCYEKIDTGITRWRNKLLSSFSASNNGLESENS